MLFLGDIWPIILVGKVRLNFFLLYIFFSIQSAGCTRALVRDPVPILDDRIVIIIRAS